MNFIKWPKRPSLRPDVIAVLELRGADSLRGILASSTDGYSGTERTTSFNLGNSVKIQRAEIEDWLKWRAAVEALWVKAGCFSAFAAAVLSLFALFKCK
jgi:hypothetical protein